MGQVVKPHQRHIIGHPQTRAVQGQARAIGHLIVGRDHGRKIHLRRQQLVHGPKTARFLKVAKHHQAIVLAHVAPGQFGAVARQPLLGIRVIERPRNKGHILMALRMQMTHGQASAFAVVKVNAEQIGRAQLATGDHHRQLLGQFDQGGIVELARQHDDAVDFAVLQQVQPRTLFFLVPVAADKQGGVMCLMQHILDAAQGLTIKRAVNELGQHPDAHGPPASQATSGGIGTKPQLVNDLPHQLLLVLADPGGAIENARDGAGGDPGLFGHHAQGGPTPLHRVHGSVLALSAAGRFERCRVAAGTHKDKRASQSGRKHSNRGQRLQ